MSSHTLRRARQLRRRTRWLGLAGLVMLAAVLGSGPWVRLSATDGEARRAASTDPEVALAGVPEEVRLDTAPPREITRLVLQKAGWNYDCMECHRSIPARWHHDRPLTEHTGLFLRHGNNRFCLNCHHPTDRNAFVDYDGSIIAEADVVLLCAKCHGPQHRDWKAGAHGRINGFWNPSIGSKER